jgi:hypothetical protein
VSKKRELKTNLNSGRISVSDAQSLANKKKYSEERDILSTGDDVEPDIPFANPDLDKVLNEHHQKSMPGLNSQPKNSARS